MIIKVKFRNFLQALNSKTLKNQKGMTLVEIMIVLVILGIIAGASITMIQSNLKKAKVKQAGISIREISKALDLYYTDCGNYPTTEEGLQALVEATSSCSEWGPDPYVRKIPKDPWNHDFIYEAEGGSFVLISLGSDGREGGTNDAKDISSEDL